MSRSDWGVAIVAGCAAFAVTAGLILSFPAAVATEVRPIQEPAAAPKATLFVDGVRLSLDVVNRGDLKPGVKPVLALIAENTASEGKCVEVEVRIDEQLIAHMFSRMPMPRVKTDLTQLAGNENTSDPRRVKETIELDSCETRRIELHPEVAITPEAMTSFVMSVGEQSVVASTFSAPLNAR